jgi:hypothetical protein
MRVCGVWQRNWVLIGFGIWEALITLHWTTSQSHGSTYMGKRKYLFAWETPSLAWVHSTLMEGTKARVLSPCLFLFLKPKPYIVVQAETVHEEIPIYLFHVVWLWTVTLVASELSELLLSESGSELVKIYGWVSWEHIVCRILEFS